jgi:hypothetical protein
VCCLLLRKCEGRSGCGKLARCVCSLEVHCLQLVCSGGVHTSVSRQHKEAAECAAESPQVRWVCSYLVPVAVVMRKLL